LFVPESFTSHSHTQIHVVPLCKDVLMTTIALQVAPLMSSELKEVGYRVGWQELGLDIYMKQITSIHP